MKYIKKGEEPKDFTDWKALESDDWKPNWDNFQAPQKSNLHESLLQEQGFICCYCGMEISKQKSHIEHLKPRKTYPEEALNYKNLLASCQREREPKEPQHCGVKKDEWYDESRMVSPLDPNCADFFRYSGSGEILPTNDPGKQDSAVTTIDKLGLNIDKLKNMRSQAIDGILQAMDGLTIEEIQILAQSYLQPDVEGKYTPFWTVIAYYIKNYFNI
jgi:uncharacterized protein (TIGR02646 family)